MRELCCPYAMPICACSRRMCALLVRLEPRELAGAAERVPDVPGVRLVHHVLDGAAQEGVLEVGLVAGAVGAADHRVGRDRRTRERGLGEERADGPDEVRGVLAPGEQAEAARLAWRRRRRRPGRALPGQRRRASRPASSAPSPPGTSKTRSCMKRRRSIAWRSPSFFPPYSFTSIAGSPGCLSSGALGVRHGAHSDANGPDWSRAARDR